MIPIPIMCKFFKPVTDFGNGFFIAFKIEPKLIEIYINKAFMLFSEINKHRMMELKEPLSTQMGGAVLGETFFSVFYSVFFKNIKAKTTEIDYIKRWQI